MVDTTNKLKTILCIEPSLIVPRERFEDIFPSKIFKGRWTKDGKWVSDRDKMEKNIQRWDEKDS